MSAASATAAVALPEWADAALEGSYAGETLFLQDAGRCITFRTQEGFQVGWINWGGWNPTIGNVHVHEKFRRLGVATELLRHARMQEPDLKHSETLSFDAQDWIAALGEAA